MNCNLSPHFPDTFYTSGFDYRMRTPICFISVLLLFIASAPVLAQGQGKDKYLTVAEARTRLLRIINDYKAGKLDAKNPYSMQVFPADSPKVYGTGRDVVYYGYLVKSLTRGESQVAFGKWKQLIAEALPEYDASLKPYIYPGRADYFLKYYLSRGPDSICVALRTGYSTGWNVYIVVKAVSSSDREGIERCRQVMEDKTSVTMANATGKPNVVGQLLDKDGIVLPDPNNGIGRIAFQNGEWFDGTMRDGKPDYGYYHFSNGDVYDGNYRNGLPSGLGTLVKANGTEYLGLFENGVLDMQSAGIKKGEHKYNLAVPASSRPQSASSGSSYTSTPSGSSSGTAGQITPEQQKVIDKYNDDMDPQARRRREASAEIDRRIERDRRRINSDYRTQYNNAQQRSQEQTQRNIDARNKEQERLNKQFNEKYNR
jgi:hypothetical protein